LFLLREMFWWENKTLQVGERALLYLLNWRHDTQQNDTRCNNSKMPHLSNAHDLLCNNKNATLSIVNDTQHNNKKCNNQHNDPRRFWRRSAWLEKFTTQPNNKKVTLSTTTVSIIILDAECRYAGYVMITIKSIMTSAVLLSVLAPFNLRVIIIKLLALDVVPHLTKVTLNVK
jgi:hypothetical protein